jgi:hypothetical protein
MYIATIAAAALAFSPTNAESGSVFVVLRNQPHFELLFLRQTIPHDDIIDLAHLLVFVSLHISSAARVVR